MYQSPTITTEFELISAEAIGLGLRKINSLGILNGRRINFNGLRKDSANNTANLKENDERILCNSFDS